MPIAAFFAAFGVIFSNTGPPIAPQNFITTCFLCLFLSCSIVAINQTL
nr:MAG TPA: hypothetical protein [Caudoviricetes sp.]